MRFGSKLWVRIFAHALLLVAIAQGGTVCLYTLTRGSEDIRNFMLDSTAELALGLKGRSLEDAAQMAAIFNGKYRRMWLEDLSGTLLAGEADKRISEGTLAALRSAMAQSGVSLRSMGQTFTGFAACTRVDLASGPAVLYMTLGGKSLPPTFFTQMLLGVALIGGVLSFWVARRISRPLQRLRGEVLEIADGDFDKRVSIVGDNEISDVARAVNQLTDNLADNLRGMRELVANISHELRSPLTRMGISCLMVEEGLETGVVRAKALGADGDDERRMALALKHLRNIQDELQGMEELIGTTLLSGKLDLQINQPFVQVDLSALVHDALQRRMIQLAALDLRVEEAVRPGIGLAGDESLLCRLTANLLDNAAKYTPTGGRVRVTLTGHSGRALLEVFNTHAPLPSEELTRVFEPFYRGGIATGNGVGLGLHLVNQIAALHHGRAWLENSPGGLAFKVELGGTADCKQKHRG